MPPEGETYRRLTRWTTARRKPFARRDIQAKFNLTYELADYYRRRLVEDGLAEPAGFCPDTGRPMYRRRR